VILPITPFTEQFPLVNAEGRAQTVQPSVKPLGDSRPAWKVLRVLGGLLDLDGFLYNLPEEVLGEALGDNYCTRLQVTKVPAIRFLPARQPFRIRAFG
jgi:NADH-quinone oxidoreductase subunit G